MTELPRDFGPLVAGEVVPLDPTAVTLAAQALAIYEGDGRAYDEDPDMREGFAERARLAIGIYLSRSNQQQTPKG